MTFIPSDDVAPDGSPVAVYLAVPGDGLVALVDSVIRPGSRVLDLGCGVGRLANGLAARGHTVTGVDESPAMLAHLDPRVRAVHARIQDLHLGERFDVVVLASHLVNTADLAERRSWLASCARHLDGQGRLLLERHVPGSLAAVGTTKGRLGPVEVTLSVLERRDEEVHATVTYVLDGRRWEQRFTARVLDDRAIDAALREVGLQLLESVTADGRWMSAGHLDGAGPIA